MSRSAGDNRREGQPSHFIDDRKFRRKNSQPIKGYSAPMTEPPRRRRRRKTIKLWKDEAAVERGRKGAATRKAKAPQRAADSEHKRRSEAAKKGWAKIPQAERTRRAQQGWETRGQHRGHPRSKEAIARDRRETRDTRIRRGTHDYAEIFPRPHYDF